MDPPSNDRPTIDVGNLVALRAPGLVVAFGHKVVAIRQPVGATVEKNQSGTRSMALRGYLYFFVEGNIDAAPGGPGVFELYDHGDVIFIGYSSTSVRAELRRHFNGDAGAITQAATAFRAVPSRHASKRHNELMAAYRAQRSALPLANRSSDGDADPA
jgi:hypothetical protein